MLKALPEYRASTKCAIFLLFFGFLIVVLELGYFILAILQGILVEGAVRGFFVGAVMLIIGLLIFNCNSNKGANSPPRNREIDDMTYLE